MSFSSPKSASRSARKQDGSSTVVLDGIRTRRIRFVSFLSASLVIMGLTLSSIHFSMLVSKKSDVSDFLQMEISVLKILNTTKKTRISANNDKAMENEISVGLQVPTIHGHAALVKGKKAPSMIMIRSNNETVEVATTSSIAAPFKSNCFPHNSKEWLEGPRLGNLNEPLMNDDFVKRMTVELPYMLASAGRATPYLGQTIAFESSRFVDDTESGDDPKSMRLWAVRLIYLSMLYHQHALAIPEAESLYGVGGDDSNTEICQKERQALGIGRYDFECPKAKYIIAALSNNGLGANMRSGATTILIAGLITGRIVHFVNNAPEGDKYLRRPWALASCDRKDAQCFFLPTSPCTITHKDIEDAYKLEGSEQRKLFKNGQIPHDHKDDKVWVIQLNMLPVLETPKQLSKSLHKYSKSLIDQVSETDPRLPILKAAMDHLLDKDLPRPGYNFAAANIKLTHALNFYGMRPNLEYSAKIDSVLDEIVPDDFDPENSFGLPIRASDKCHGESECLSFYQHMEATSQLWQEHQNATGTDRTDPAVVFTSEAKSMVQGQRDFETNTTLQKDFPLSFQFLTNHKDVTPDSGFVQNIKKTMNFTADESMLSAVTSLKFQLLPRVSLGNCCSNFHVLLNDFLVEGLGAASENTFKCLQEFEDPRLKICCGWHHKCKRVRAEALAVLANKTAAASDI